MYSINITGIENTDENFKSDMLSFIHDRTLKMHIDNMIAESTYRQYRSSTYHMTSTTNLFLVLDEDMYKDLRDDIDSKINSGDIKDLNLVELSLMSVIIKKLKPKFTNYSITSVINDLISRIPDAWDRIDSYHNNREVYLFLSLIFEIFRGRGFDYDLNSDVAFSIYKRLCDYQPPVQEYEDEKPNLIILEFIFNFLNGDIENLESDISDYIFLTNNQSIFLNYLLFKLNKSRVNFDNLKLLSFKNRLYISNFMSSFTDDKILKRCLGCMEVYFHSGDNVDVYEKIIDLTMIPRMNKIEELYIHNE